MLVGAASRQTRRLIACVTVTLNIFDRKTKGQRSTYLRGLATDGAVFGTGICKLQS